MWAWVETGRSGVSQECVSGSDQNQDGGERMPHARGGWSSFCEAAEWAPPPAASRCRLHTVVASCGMALLLSLLPAMGPPTRSEHGSRHSAIAGGGGAQLSQPLLPQSPPHDHDRTGGPGAQAAPQEDSGGGGGDGGGGGGGGGAPSAARQASRTVQQQAEQTSRIFSNLINSGIGSSTGGWVLPRQTAACPPPPRHFSPPDDPAPLSIHSPQWPCPWWCARWAWVWQWVQC